MITIPSQERRAERMDAHRQAIYDSNGLLCQAVLSHFAAHAETFAAALASLLNRGSSTEMVRFMMDAIDAEVERADRQRQENDS